MKTNYSYKAFKNDPGKLRVYKLSNGFTVYLSKNTDEPKIQTRVVVRAGSNFDPKENTGLAHYLEHMLFKGTQKYGTLNWPEEQKYLEKLSALFETHRNEHDPVKKAEIYRTIDRLSVKASEYAIANEYDKIAESIGAENTNAHTWYEETVFKDQIPSGELEKWALLESERFSNLVLRLFHTELETVYEEFNRAQDNDSRKKLAQTLEGLFPEHPYGRQTTLGKAEHLKNPSMVAIHRFFDRYYVPENMAIVLVGDLDFEKTLAILDRTFGKYKAKKVEHPVLPDEKPLTKPVVKEVFGPSSESVYVAFRTPAIRNTREVVLVKLIDKILSNFQAGLFDLHLNQQQKLQRAVSFTLLQNDYGIHFLDGYPLQGQSLEEVKDLMLNELERIKNGDFDDWLLPAVINDFKLKRLKDFESSEELANAFADTFVHHLNWQDVLDQIELMEQVTKKDLMDFASKNYRQNYVVTYKRKGLDQHITKVENPKITPIHLNRDQQSEFFREFLKIPSKSIEPVFIDYNQQIERHRMENGIEVLAVENKTNSRFTLSFIIDYGIDHNKKLVLACNYINYLGTKNFEPEQLKIEFYKIGISYKIEPRNDRTLISLSGLRENMMAGLKLFFQFWNGVLVDAGQYKKFVTKVLRSREERKSKKDTILWNGLLNFAKYGENSRLRNIYSAKELQEIDPAELTAVFRELKQFKKQIFYYGKDPKTFVNELDALHFFPENYRSAQKKFDYKHLDTTQKVYFTDFKMVQAEVLLLSKKNRLDAASSAYVMALNSYFGSGLSSIIFQELRESRSLAYSTFASYLQAHKKTDPDYWVAYIGTQANKLDEALEALLQLMQDMPLSEKQFEQALKSSIKQIAAERITKEQIFWNYLKLKDLGIHHDIREDIYRNLHHITLNDLYIFFKEKLSDSSFVTLVIGDKNELDVKHLEQFGTFKELDTDYLFNFRTD